ncbi:MAG: hypothetical protein ABIG71_04455 [Candidatus Uhrbacteria bacterium]
MLRWLLMCVMAVSFCAGHHVYAQEADERSYATWAECEQCSKSEKQKCKKGKLGRACRRMKRKCVNIESDCFELRKIFEAPLSAEEEEERVDESDSVPEPSPPPAKSPASTVRERVPEATPEPYGPVESMIFTHPPPTIAAPSPPKPDDPLWTIVGYSGLGVGALLVGVGAWQGIVALDESTTYVEATTQRQALAARDRGLAAAMNANVLFAAGGVVAGTSITLLILDALGVLDAKDGTAISVGLRDNGAQLFWSVSVP